MIQKLKKLYDWLPIIWQDEDWDYAYLLRMMRFKLERMRKLQETSGHGAHRLDVAKQIMEAEIMIRNIVEDDPDDEWIQHYDQWHNSPLVWKEVGNGLCEMTDECGAVEEHAQSSELSSQRDLRNWAALWDHLNKYLRHFWD